MSHSTTTTIERVRDVRELELLRELLREYRDTSGAPVCFASFDKELAALPGDCVPPRGGWWLARVDGNACGCVALLPLGQPGAAELRRLFVRRDQRGAGLGRRLVERVIDEARRAGHSRVLLHTLPSMRAAHALYLALGFQPIVPYEPGPPPEAVFLGIELEP